MSACPHYFALKNKSCPYVPESNNNKVYILERKETPSISSESNMQDAIEKAAVAYNANRMEVQVKYTPSGANDDQSISLSVPTWDDSTRLASFFASNIEELLPIAGWRGSGTKQFLLATRDIHLTMREQYSQMIHQVGRNIFPCIVASENDMNYRGVGSMFTLYLEDGSTRRTKVPAPEYEIYKNLSHISLGIYSIISPYFLQPTAGGWEDKLKSLGSKITAALSVLESESPKHVHCRNMLRLSQEFIQQCLDCKAVHVSPFQKYCESMLPLVTVAMARAAEIQVASAKPQLEAWKMELEAWKMELEAAGKWKSTYVIIPTVWPVGHNNPRQQLFKQLMDEDQFKTHVIMSEMPRDIDESFNLLGRVVGDRIAARLIFGCSTPGARSMVCALSTERDLISDACEDAIEKIFGNDSKTAVENHVSPSLTASQLHDYAAQSISSELQKALLHTAALMEMEENKKTMQIISNITDSVISIANKTIPVRQTILVD